MATKKKNTTLLKIVAEAKRIQKAHPHMKWTNAIKDASKHIKEGAKTVVQKTKSTKKTIGEISKKDFMYKGYFVDISANNGFYFTRSKDYGYLKADTKEGIKKLINADLKKKISGVVSSKFSPDELKFIQSEIKNSKGYKYRGKLLFGQFVVLKETEKGTPIKKWIVDTMEVANAISHELNTQKKFKKIKSSKI